MSIHELRFLGRHQQITSQRNLKTRRHRKTVNRSDYRLLTQLHLHNRIGIRVLHIPLEHVLRRGQVDAGAEGPTRPGEDDDPDRIVGGQAPDRAGHVFDHRAGERIEGLGAVDEHEGDAARVAVDENQLIRRRRRDLHWRGELDLCMIELDSVAYIYNHGICIVVEMRVKHSLIGDVTDNFNISSCFSLLTVLKLRDESQ